MRLFLLSISLGVGLLPLRAGLSFSMDGFALCRVRLQLGLQQRVKFKSFCTVLDLIMRNFTETLELYKLSIAG
jgi:hypothetical protein